MLYTVRRVQFILLQAQLFSPSPGVSGLSYNYQHYFCSLSCTHTLSRSPFQATLLHLRRFEGVGGSQGFFARCSFPTAVCGIARTLQGTLCQLSLKACRGVGEDLHTAQAGPDLNTSPRWTVHCWVNNDTKITAASWSKCCGKLVGSVPDFFLPSPPTSTFKMLLFY